MAAYKISQFASLAGVSVRLLHHYDRIGLLRPEHVDHVTGCRRYSLDQLPRLNRILALKDLGFSLSQIGKLLEDGLTPAQLRAIHAARVQELRNHIVAESERLARAELWLQHIDAETVVPDVVVKPIPPMTGLVCRVTIQTGTDIAAWFYRISGALQARYPAMCFRTSVGVYHQFPLSHPMPLDVAFDVTPLIDEPFSIEPDVIVQRGRLEGYQAAATALHYGPDLTRGPTIQALVRWIDRGGFEPVGVRREQYLRRGTPDQHVTEVQIPFRRAIR